MPTPSTDCRFEKLSDRTLVRITGDDATKFLQNLVTCEVEKLAEREAAFGALLTPQGKILFDFFLIRTKGGFLADIGTEFVDALVKRLVFYRLRAKVEFETEETIGVFAAWGMEPEPGDGIRVHDPRSRRMGWRIYGASPPACQSGDYREHRIDIGMPAGGADYAYGDTFPHEALMDQFRGVDFTKGCFVGQEVVSRMQHRGTARKRVVKVASEHDLPATGTELRAGGKPVGSLGSVDRSVGMALVRLDRVSAALAAGEPVLAGDVPVTMSLQDFVTYGWPQATG